MRPYERTRKARHQFVEMNGVDPWGDTAPGRGFLGITCQFCGFLFGLIGVLGFVLFLGAIMGAL